MARVIVRPAGYTGSLQRLVWAQGNNVPVTAYLWGGGGGGGGNDSSRGGNGGGGGFTEMQFTINVGDVLEVAVGGPGGPGVSGTRGAGGGNAGASLVLESNFNTVDNIAPGPPVVRQYNSRYCTFLNTYGVWIDPTSARTFDRTYSVNFPITTNYQFTASVDNYATFYIDGVEAFYADNFVNEFTVSIPVTAGNHTIRILGINTGGPGAVALTINQGTSYSGARGGNAGGSGSSGAGGGGGGATVVLLNGVPIGAAAGGGGGGGGGNVGLAIGESAPGTRGQAPVGQNAGQNGQNKDGDGGGGGGGGGGWGGGNGGTTPGGDVGAGAGVFGLSSGVFQNPSGRTPGGISNPYYRGSVAQGGTFGGGTGLAGYAVFEFQVPGTFVHTGGSFQPVIQTYAKLNDIWSPVKATYIKENGTWSAVNGSEASVFGTVSGRFGINPRAGEGGEGGGGGGGKIICTKLYELGLMSKEIYEADQAFGAELVAARPDIYNGYRAWAEIVVDWMDGNGPNMMPWLSEQRRREITQQWSTSWAQEIATPWAEEMAYQMGKRPFGNSTGKAIMAVGTPICKAVGVWQRVIGPSKNPAGFGKGLMLIPVFVALKTVAVLGKLLRRN